jgi:hypothetical protein
MVLIQTSSGTTALNRNAVQEVLSIGGPLKTTFDRKTRAAALRLKTSGPGGKGRIVVQYLAKGITWAPSCAIDITDAQKARITTKAEIIDETEDLENVPVSFVTGYPNLKFSDVIDPLAPGVDLRTFLTSLSNPSAAGAMGAATRQVALQGATGNFAYADAFEASFPEYSTEPQGGQTREELFFYEPRTVTLGKGERGYYPLFTEEVPYQHLYEWKIGDAIDVQERYGNPQPDEEEKTEDVWHSIRLTNSGTTPWTTAPAMTMQEGQILGQDLIHYTSPGGKTTVRITKAVDIKAEQAESEVERKRNAATFYGNSYDLVDVRGTLKARNFKDKRITLTVTKELSGEVVTTLPQARVEQTARGLKKVNPKSVLTWELPVDPRRSIEVTYSYKVYVRN